MAQTYTLGKVSITPRGAFSPNVVYSPLDLFSYNGSSYLVTASVFGVAPPNDSYYMQIGSKGDTGTAGIAATISVGSVTSTPANTNPTVTNSGTTAEAVFNFTIPSGNKWYVGTGVTGTSTTGTVFSGSGVANAGVGDLYLNSNSDSNGGNVYKCTLGGNASTAKWAFVMSILGTMDNTVAYTAQSSKTSTQRITALANVGIHIGSTPPSSITTADVPVGELYAYFSA